VGYVLPCHLLKIPGVHAWGTYPIPAALVWFVLYERFAMWSFVSVWGLGLLLLFREQLNHVPGKLGQQVISGAYGAYLIHPVFIVLWAWAFMGLPVLTLTANAIAISPLAVVSSWAFTALVRWALPCTRRVLG
jgi:hypothetical protein